MKSLIAPLMVFALCHATFAQEAKTGTAIPPPMPKRPVPTGQPEPAGQRIDIVDGDCKTLLFIPESYTLPADGSVDLTVHFHTNAGYIIPEHLRRGMKSPLLVAHLGEGSSVYGRPFKDVDRFARMIGLIETQLSSTTTKATIANVDITSFSAGYGAVRELVKDDRYIRLIRRIVLADSLYASWDPATTQPGATSRPAAENMDPFTTFVKLAAEGKKTFVLTHSFVPTPYANTAATAAWIIETAGATAVPVEHGALPATLDELFPLRYRADKGHLHVWGYGGEDAHAHLTHVRHIADIWMALDAAGEP